MDTLRRVLTHVRTRPEQRGPPEEVGVDFDPTHSLHVLFDPRSERSCVERLPILWVQKRVSLGSTTSEITNCKCSQFQPAIDVTDKCLTQLSNISIQHEGSKAALTLPVTVFMMSPVGNINT